jgi:hypothetical protein
MLSGVAIGTPPCRLLVKHVSLVASATLVQPAYRGAGQNPLYGLVDTATTAVRLPAVLENS